MTLSSVTIEYLQSTFGTNWERSWIESCKCLPKTKKRDPATVCRGLAKDARPADDDAVYVSASIFRPGTKRADENIESVHLLVVDDVGTKIDKDLVDSFCLVYPYSWRIESSPDNWQYHWSFPEGITVEEHAAKWATMEQAFGALDGKSPSQLFRVPQGVNGKDDQGHRDFRVHGEKGEGSDIPGSPGKATTKTSNPGKSPQRATLEEVREVLKRIPNDGWDYDRWIRIGIAIYGALGEEGYELWLEWSHQQPDGDYTPEEKWETFKGTTSAGFGALEIEAKAAGGMAASVFDDGTEIPPVAMGGPRTYDDFWAFVPKGWFIDMRTGDLWTDKAALNNVLPGTPGGPKGKLIPASDVLQRTKAVHQMSWMPGKGKIVSDTKVMEGGIEICPGNTIYNKYEPAVVKPGDPAKAGRWLDHVKKLYPLEWEGIVSWMAHRVQRPGEKINHALVLGGDQGIGKDMILEPLKTGVGEHNVKSIDPPELLGRFNGYRQAVVLVVNEIHNLGDNLNPYRFYEQTKTLIAAPPRTLRVDEKYIGHYAIPNVVGVVMTTNHKLDGLYLEENDRRHFIAWSNVRVEAFKGDYFDVFWDWMEGGGREHVVAWLRSRDLSKFNPKAPPEKTVTWREIVGASDVDGQDEMISDTLGALGNPDCFTRRGFMAKAPDRLQEWADKASKPFANKLDKAGYQKSTNSAAKSGRYKVAGTDVTIYAKRGADVAAFIRKLEDEEKKARKNF
jgi:hypothetical protein